MIHRFSTSISLSPGDSFNLSQGLLVYAPTGPLLLFRLAARPEIELLLDCVVDRSERLISRLYLLLPNRAAKLYVVVPVEQG